MKRRSFFSASAGTSMLLTGSRGFAQKERKESTGGTSPLYIGQIGKYTIEQIRNQYEYDLFEFFGQLSLLFPWYALIRHGIKNVVFFFDVLGQ